MTRFDALDPFDRLRWRERRAWRSAEKRVSRAHESEQLAALVQLASTGGGVTGVRTPDTDVCEGAAPVELLIDGRRLRAARVHRRSIVALKEALAGVAAVPLTAVDRYGPYWVLTFKVATEHLVVLVDHLTLLPDWGGAGGRGRVPTGPVAALS